MIPALLDHLWQSTLFAVAAALLAFAFRKRRAAVRYAIWFSASLKFLVPFALLMTLGSRLPWPPASAGVVTRLSPPSIPLAIAHLAQPSAGALLPPQPSRPARDWTRAILGVWPLGFAAMALIRFRGWLRVRSALRASAFLGNRAAVELRSTPGLLEPGVVGFLRPVLLLPADIEARLTPAQLEAVLAHELCHVRRRDNLSAAVHMLVEAAFWFHPAVWWIGARLLHERERACDEEVLRQGAEPRLYAEAILNVCRVYAESPLVCVAGVTGANLHQRIEAIMANRKSLSLNFANKIALAAAAFCALATPIVIGIGNAPRARAQSAPPGTPKFETVSIQPGCAAPAPAEPRKSRDGVRKTGAPDPPSPGTLTVNCMTVAQMLHAAYARFASGRPLADGDPLWYLDSVPMSGGPAWIYSDQYRIKAKAHGDPSEEMLRGPMMQALLEDRFQLKVRRETRTVEAYALTLAAGGPKMPQYTGDCVPDSVLPPLPPGQKHCWEIGAGERKDRPSFTPSFGPDTVVKDLDGFALWLFIMTDRPVVNKTGLTGRFFMSLSFAPDESTPGALARLAVVARRTGEPIPARSNPPGPSISTALEQQLGLKLEPVTAPRDFLTVERAERPR